MQFCNFIIKQQYTLNMKRRICSVLCFLVVRVLVNLACSSTQKGDVSKDAKYADIVNLIFITKAPLYYYHYTHTDSLISVYFLSVMSYIYAIYKCVDLPFC